ncbi:MAG: FmdB family zinc ribbon protein [bacterium]
MIELPIFEYECRNCSKSFEILGSAKTKPRCPFCKSRKTTRIFSAFSIGGKSRSDKVEGTKSSCRTCLTHNCSSCG